MRFARRALATTVATLALTAGAVTVAGSAAASPEDGEGCVGLPSNHAVYVCVISVTPMNALPGTSSTPLNVPVPEVCYYLDCTDETTVTVPVPGVTEGSGQVATLWHNDVYYPIAVGTDGAFSLLTTALDLALGAYQTAYDTAWREYGDAMELVGREYDDAMEMVSEQYYYVTDTLNNLDVGYTLYSRYRSLTRNTYVRLILETAGVEVDWCDTWNGWLGGVTGYYDYYCYY
ncbi:MAG TPA: hypothetical protein VNQ77_12340 [Frankiaceae bacterium]|nr:hypothetical protein [Frankiaceae bacterium]